MLDPDYKKIRKGPLAGILGGAARVEVGKAGAIACLLTIKTALEKNQSSIREGKIDFIYVKALIVLALGLHIVNLVCNGIQFELCTFR
ncbi:hypothetical protein [Nostoc sp. MS1]|uniref:hypothetical protein n=1 Tax=Nostoc sp. MS1 TaxID=2764711 RepID=UPI001CC62B48|nr:hypothetical protein [Nostoc sp. MS1]